MQSKLVLGYLDDVKLECDADTCLKVFLCLEAVAKKLCLEMNRSKCEVVGHTDIAKTLFVDHNVDLPKTSSSTVILLGSSLSAGQHLDDMFEEKKQELIIIIMSEEFNVTQTI
jgi:hypothetical protein